MDRISDSGSDDLGSNPDGVTKDTWKHLKVRTLQKTGDGCGDGKNKG